MSPEDRARHDDPVDSTLLDGARERMPLADNDGKSGAVIERAVLADGTRVIVKCFDPAQDMVMRLTGDTRGREVELFTSGVLDRLPEGSATAS